MADLSGTIILITGAAGNLGSAVAQAAHAAGGTVVLVDRGEERLREIYGASLAPDRHLLIGGIDLTDPDSVKGMVGQTIQRFGQIDALVQTVGGYRAGTPLHETPLETLDFMFNLNARTAFIVAQAVIPHMLEHGTGKIVNIAARAGLAGSKNHAAYSAAKSAVIRLTESMAAELKHQGINVNCILPGTIDTPQNRDAMPNADFDRWVSPDALADAILFLVSDAARAVHGAALPVYGRS